MIHLFPRKLPWFRSNPKVEWFYKTTLERSLSIVSTLYCLSPWAALAKYFLNLRHQFHSIHRFVKLESGDYPSINEILGWYHESGFNFVEHELLSIIDEMYGYETIEWRVWNATSCCVNPRPGIPFFHLLFTLKIKRFPRVTSSTN